MLFKPCAPLPINAVNSFDSVQNSSSVRSLVKIPTLFRLLVGCLFLVSCKPQESGDSRVAPLVLSDPGEGTPFPHFTWSRHPGAFADPERPVRYEIQIARDEAFRDLLDQDEIFLNRYVPDRPLPYGLHYWRVRALPGDERAEPWSGPGRCRVSPCDETIQVSCDPADKDPQQAVQEAINKAVEWNKQGKTVEVVFSKSLYLSKNSRKCFLQIKGANGLVVNGNGSEVHLLDYDATFCQISDSRNVVVRDFTVDMPEQLPMTQGRVVSVDRGSATVEVRLEEGFPTFDDGYFAKAEGSIKLLDPQVDGRLKSGANNYFLIAKETIRRLGEHHYSFQIAPPSYAVDKGRVVPAGVDPGKLAQYFEPGDRFIYALNSPASALAFATNSEAITYYQIVNYAAIRHFWGLSCSRINVLHCRVVLKEGRWFNGLADGIHCRGNKIGPWIEGVEINGIGDDGVALYTRPMAAVSTGEGKRFVLKAENFSAEPGDEVTFFRPQNGKILLETRVREVRPAAGNWEVVLEDPVPGDLVIGGSLVESDQIWNRSKSCGDFVVRNNRLLGIRRYGTVFRAKTGVVENNLFNGTSASAIIFLNETQYPNGLYPSDIIIRNNEIRDCAFDTIPTAAITLLFKRLGSSEPAESLAPHGILIENNRISGCLRPALEIWSARDVIVRGNTVNGHPLEAADARQVVLKNVSNVRWGPLKGPQGSKDQP